MAQIANMTYEGEIFGVPDAKRVRRSELFDRSSSPTSSIGSRATSPEYRNEELETILHARLAGIYGPVSLSSANSTDPSTFALKKQTRAKEPHTLRQSVDRDEEGSSEDEILSGEADDKEAASQSANAEEFEFRLFSTPSKSKPGAQDTTIQKIVLYDPDAEDAGEGHFIVPRRDPRYYFAAKVDARKRAELARVAVTSDDVFRLSKGRAWGLEVPWRVKVLSVKMSKGVQVAGNTDEGTEDLTDGEGETKRKRPGKKLRIILRERKKVSDLKAEQKKREMERREEAEREKRTRRNREKKVKRKIRVMAKKAGDGAHSDVGGGAQDGSLKEGREPDDVGGGNHDAGSSSD